MSVPNGIDGAKRSRRDAIVHRILTLAFLTAVLVAVAAANGLHPDYVTKAAASDQKAVGPARRTTGSAFLVGSDGYLVTNAHVVTDCDDPQLVIGGQTSPFKIKLIDTNIDIAILLNQALVGKDGFSLKTDVQIGQHVTVFGYPLAPDYSENGRPTIGVLLALSKDRRRLMTNAQVQAGNSGGPIIDQSGSVVGVAFGKNVNRTFAVAASAVIEVFGILNICAPVSNSDKIMSVADIVARARQVTGKVDCKRSY